MQFNHLRGGKKAYDSKQHNLLTVFDMEKEGYRLIPVDAIQRLSVNGQILIFLFKEAVMSNVTNLPFIADIGKGKKIPFFLEYAPQWRL